MDEREINLLLAKVTRLEIINHSSKGDLGRVFVNRNDSGKIEVSLQDNNRTLKIFIINK